MVEFLIGFENKLFFLNSLVPNVGD
jgi:hypothetical protein